MDRLKLTQLGERLKTGRSQMSRFVSDKVKEILQNPTRESKMVDESTLETIKEANWGMNLRICDMINGELFSGTEVVRAIKKKISGKSVVSQRLSLGLLESLKGRTLSALADDGNSARCSIPWSPMCIRNQFLLPGCMAQTMQLTNISMGICQFQEQNEFLFTTLNSLELLSSILNAENEPKSIKHDLTVSLLEKCKQSQPVIQRIIESTNGDKTMLCEALNIHEELQKIIAQYEEMEAGLRSGECLPGTSDSIEANLPAQIGLQDETKTEDYPIGVTAESDSNRRDLKQGVGV